MGSRLRRVILVGQDRYPAVDAKRNFGVTTSAEDRYRASVGVEKRDFFGSEGERRQLSP